MITVEKLRVCYGAQQLIWRHIIRRFILVFSIQLLLLAVAVSLLGL